MKAGDRISVHAASSYTDEAIISTMCHPDELPALEGAPNIEAVRAILAEGSFVSVALIEYKFFGETLAFIALENTRGHWYDLKGQQLLIEPRRAENAAREFPGMRIATRKPRVDYSKF
jgi:hypothetical protein